MSIKGLYCPKNKPLAVLPLQAANHANEVITMSKFNILKSSTS